MPKLIAVVDDEPDILELVGLHLRKAGFRVEGFADAGHFYRFLSTKVPNLVILDLMLPDADGMDVCRYMKSEARLAGVPIIMLTARVEETDRVLGLESGADDYVTKPFSPRELVARVRTVLRRLEHRPSGTGAIAVGRFLIDPNRFSVLVDNKPVELTATEFRILEVLARQPGRVFSRDQLIEGVWGYDKPVIDRVIDTHIRNLREKLGTAGDAIRTVRGVGYRFTAD
ncbi:MAG: response regulator transcription factor [candidate division WOR-3 bacterium]